MSDERTTVNHESFGKLRISKVTGGIGLFDSHIQGDGAIQLTISTAEVDRHLNHDWIHDREELIQIYLSPLQWAEAITTAMNCEGVPCTLSHVAGVRKESPPVKDVKAQFRSEVEKGFEDRIVDVEDANERLKELLEGKGSIKKSELREIQGILDKGVRHFKANIAYTEKCFSESVDRTVLEAKQSIHHYVDATIRTLGIESLKDLNNIKMIEIDSDEASDGK